MKHLYILVLSVMLIGSLPADAYAHEGASEVQEGAELSGALESGAKKCADLTDADFEFLGEFFMDRMMGESHESMNSMMKQTMGDSGEEQMHAVMGKRMSGCDASAQMPAGMMSMMGNGGMMSGRGAISTQNFGSAMRGLQPIGFITLGYVVGILGAIALALVIVKYLKELFK